MATRILLLLILLLTGCRLFPGLSGTAPAPFEVRRVVTADTPGAQPFRFENALKSTVEPDSTTGTMAPEALLDVRHVKSVKTGCVEMCTAPFTVLRVSFKREAARVWFSLAPAARSGKVVVLLNGQPYAVMDGQESGWILEDDGANLVVAFPYRSDGREGELAERIAADISKRVTPEPVGAAYGASCREIRQRIAALKIPGVATYAYHGGVGLSVDSGAPIDLKPFAGIPFRAAHIEDPVSDLTHLRGMPLQLLVVRDLRAGDLAPLAGMPLAELFVGSAPTVTSLAPLKGMPLTALTLMNTLLVDLSPLAGMPLTRFAIFSSVLADLSPVASLRLHSLSVACPKVLSLEPLAAMTSLEELRLWDSSVSDVTPLKRLPLTELVFEPGKIRHGMDALRTMATLRSISAVATKSTDPAESSGGPCLKPAEFWRRYDAGEFR